MKHIRLHNLATHDIVCDVSLTSDDLALIRALVERIDHETRIDLRLSDDRKASLELMPDTAFPIIRTK